MTKEDRRREASHAEDKVIETIRKVWPHHYIARTSERYSEVDGIAITRETNQIESVFEVKCRNLSMIDLMGKFKCSITIASSKLNSMQRLSEQLKVPSVLYTYTMMDGCLFGMQITDRNGVWVCKRLESSEKMVPSVVGGDLIKRDMSNLSMENGVLLSANGWTGVI